MAKRKYLIFWIFMTVFMIIGIYLLYIYPKQQDEATSVVDQNFSDPTQTEPLEPKVEIYSVTEPSSIWVIVNKQNPLPLDYTPKLIVPKVQLNASSNAEYMHVSSAIKTDFENMVNQAKQEGISLVLSSGYRSAGLQASVYQNYVNQDGRQQADTYSARPGHSEHQTGLAVDVHSAGEGCVIEQCWADTRGGKWVAANAHRYGFIVRYPAGKQEIVGYTFEPWHLRYVGVDVASQIFDQKNTLEEFFGYDWAPDY